MDWQRKDTIDASLPESSSKRSVRAWIHFEDSTVCNSEMHLLTKSSAPIKKVVKIQKIKKMKDPHLFLYKNPSEKKYY